MALQYSYLLKLQEQMARKEKASDIGKEMEKKRDHVWFFVIIQRQLLNHLTY